VHSIPMPLREFNAGAEGERRTLAEELVTEFASGVAPAKCLDELNLAWTNWVRERFARTCPPDCQSVPDGTGCSKEFLVDFIWEERNDGKRLILACESEWAADRFGKHTHWKLVEEDFEKLLVIKAPFKVLIFSSNSKNQDDTADVDFSIGRALKSLTRSLENYWHHLPGETYILLDFPATGDPSSSGVFKSYIRIADRNGKQTVSFVERVGGELNRS